MLVRRHSTGRCCCNYLINTLRSICWHGNSTVGNLFRGRLCSNISNYISNRIPVVSLTLISTGTGTTTTSTLAETVSGATGTTKTSNFAETISGAIKITSFTILGTSSDCISTTWTTSSFTGTKGSLAGILTSLSALISTTSLVLVNFLSGSASTLFLSLLLLLCPNSDFTNEPKPFAFFCN